MKFQKPYGKPRKLSGEINSGEVLVEPNCCMPLRQMLIRYANGQPINVPKVDSTYTSDYVKDLEAYNVLRERGLELADAEKVYQSLRKLHANIEARSAAANAVQQQTTSESEQKPEQEQVKP